MRNTRLRRSTLIIGERLLLKLSCKFLYALNFKLRLRCSILSINMFQNLILFKVDKLMLETRLNNWSLICFLCAIWLWYVKDSRPQILTEIFWRKLFYFYVQCLRNWLVRKSKLIALWARPVSFNYLQSMGKTWNNFYNLFVLRRLKCLSGGIVVLFRFVLVVQLVDVLAILDDLPSVFCY